MGSICYICYFESLLIPLDTTKDENKKCDNTLIYQEHKAFSFALFLISHDGKKDKFYEYSGNDCVEKFLHIINKIQYQISDYIKTTNIDYNLTYEEEKHFKETNICHICENKCNNKVVDHDHLTGKYRGPTFSSCNINYNLKYYKIPIFIHNSKNYDTHLLNHSTHWKNIETKERRRKKTTI